MLARSPRNLAVLSFTVFFFVLVVYHQAPWSPSLANEQISLGWQLHAGVFGGEGGSHKNASLGAGKLSPDNSDTKPIYPLWTSDFESDPDAEPSIFPWLTVKGKSKSLVDGVKEDSEPVENWGEYMNKMLDWDRPMLGNHWPPYWDYVGRNYDPNRWEGFERCVVSPTFYYPDLPHEGITNAYAVQGPTGISRFA
jgi:hypothetical protein